MKDLGDVDRRSTTALSAKLNPRDKGLNTMLLQGACPVQRDLERYAGVPHAPCTCGHPTPNHLHIFAECPDLAHARAPFKTALSNMHRLTDSAKAYGLMPIPSSVAEYRAAMRNKEKRPELPPLN